MGIDLILAMVIAGMITRAYEHSKRRSAAGWGEARPGAADHRAEREKARNDRHKARANARAARRRRMTQARKGGPSDPLWWPYAVGWLAAALVRGGVAAVKGAREGARTGAAEGYRIGKERARQRKARQRREEAAYRNGHRAGRDDGRTEAEREHAQRTQPPGPERDMVPCPRCGVYMADPAACTCTTTATAGDPVTTPEEQQARGASPDAPRPLPNPGTEITTGTATPAARAASAAFAAVPGLAGSFRAPREPASLTTTSPAGGELIGAASHAAMPPTGGHRQEVIDAEIVSDPNTTPNNPTHDNPTHSNPIPGGKHHMTEMQAISVNGAGVSGGDGEGYASTISAMDQIKTLINSINGVVTDLGDTLTSKNVDQATTNYLSELDDLLQSAETTVEQARNHAEQQHSEVAAAIAGAGGSQNIADTDWYDDL